MRQSGLLRTPPIAVHESREQLRDTGVLGSSAGANRASCWHEAFAAILLVGQNRGLLCMFMDKQS